MLKIYFVFMVLAAVLSFEAVSCAEVAICYNEQYQWKNFPHSSCGGLKQSPINIQTVNVREDKNLFNGLDFYRWDASRSGTFVNDGHSMQFNPYEHFKTAGLRNHRSWYRVEQFHFHWGARQGEGSEHRVNGYQADGEIHFVTKNLLEPGSGPDAYSVVAVFLEVDNYMPITGIWRQLKISGGTSTVYNINYNELLPPKRDYYYYEGSLTTPPCSEIVQWFVLKYSIKVPGSFIRMLRKIPADKACSQTDSTFNFRQVQALNGRQVFTPARQRWGK